MPLTRRALQILEAMARGAAIFYIDNDSCHGQHPVLCEGRSISKVTRPMLESLLTANVICGNGKADPTYQITNLGRAAIKAP